MSNLSGGTRTNIIRDMYGFARTEQYVAEERRYQSETGEVTKRRADLEWIQYLKAIGGPGNVKPAGRFKPSQDLKALVRKGIPIAFRSLLWMELSLVNVTQSNYPDNYYQTLLSRCDTISDKTRLDIEKDVDRTFPEHESFESEATIGCLRRVLQAHAVHNPDIGYCQSLNFVAGMMLLFMEEEDVFWLLVTTVDILLPKDYYSKSMVGVYTDQFVLSHLLKKYLPKINDKLLENSLQLPLITVQWFTCLFVNTLRPEVALRIWDMFFAEGSKVIFRISMALFKHSEAKILAAKDASELFLVLRNLGHDIVDADVLISLAYKNKSGSSTVKKPYRNPRLRIQSLVLGEVPSSLLGIGTAHIGPLKATTTMDEAGADLSPNNSTSPLIRPPSHNKVYSSPQSSPRKNRQSIGTGGILSSPPSPDTKNPHYIETLGARSIKTFTFTFQDIEYLRSSYRPDLEARFLQLEKNREKWRLEREKEEMEQEEEEEEEENDRAESKSNFQQQKSVHPIFNDEQSEPQETKL